MTMSSLLFGSNERAYLEGVDRIEKELIRSVSPGETEEDLNKRLETRKFDWLIDCLLGSEFPTGRRAELIAAHARMQDQRRAATRRLQAGDLDFDSFTKAIQDGFAELRVACGRVLSDAEYKALLGVSKTEPLQLPLHESGGE